jgi:hypothetical protein
MKPSIGRIVIVRTHESFNGSNEHPAVITRVWSNNDPAEAKGSFVCVNVTALPDLSAPVPMGSQQLFETKEEAEAAGSSSVAWWPERVG